MLRAHASWALIAGVAAVAVLAVPAAAPSQTIPSPEETRAHWAKGEVFYGEQWTPLDRLFETYMQTCSEMQGIVDKGKAARQKEAEASRELSKVRGEESSKKSPLYQEQRQLQAWKARMERIQTLRPPAEPAYIREPTFSSGYYRNNNNNNNNDYDRARQSYEAERDRVRRENAQRKDQWRKVCDELKSAQTRAQKELADTDQKLKDAGQKLDDLKKEYADKGTPYMEQIKAAREESAAQSRQASSLIGRKALLEKVFAETPEPILWQQGIVQWEGSYHKVAELQALYDQTQAEIGRIREELKAAAEKGGREFPPDWRHPQQDRMESLRLLLAKVNSARGA